jgi:hypothetical protein
VGGQCQYTYEQAENRQSLQLSVAGSQLPSWNADLQKSQTPSSFSASSLTFPPLLGDSLVAGGAVCATWTDSESSVDAFMGVKASLCFGETKLEGTGRLRLRTRNNEMQRLRGFLELSFDGSDPSTHVTASVTIHFAYWKTRRVSLAQQERENYVPWLQDQMAALTVTLGPNNFYPGSDLEGEDDDFFDNNDDEDEEEGDEEKPKEKDTADESKPLAEDDTSIPLVQELPLSREKPQREQQVALVQIAAGVTISLGQLKKVTGTAVGVDGSLGVLKQGSPNGLDLDILVKRCDMKLQMQGNVAVLQNFFLECQVQLNMRAYNAHSGTSSLLSVKVTLCFITGEKTFLCLEPKGSASRATRRGATAATVRSKLVFLDGALRYISGNLEVAGRNGNC